ncbi:unnamed protein product, partial [Chrysoparadoxa australica]
MMELLRVQDWYVFSPEESEATRHRLLDQAAALHSAMTKAQSSTAPTLVQGTRQWAAVYVEMEQKQSAHATALVGACDGLRQDEAQKLAAMTVSSPNHPEVNGSIEAFMDYPARLAAGETQARYSPPPSPMRKWSKCAATPPRQLQEQGEKKEVGLSRTSAPPRPSPLPPRPRTVSPQQRRKKGQRKGKVLQQLTARSTDLSRRYDAILQRGGTVSAEGRLMEGRLTAGESLSEMTTEDLMSDAAQLQQILATLDSGPPDLPLMEEEELEEGAIVKGCATLKLPREMPAALTPPMMDLHIEQAPAQSLKGLRLQVGELVSLNERCFEAEGGSARLNAALRRQLEGFKRGWQRNMDVLESRSHGYASAVQRECSKLQQCQHLGGAEETLYETLRQREEELAEVTRCMQDEQELTAKAENKLEELKQQTSELLAQIAALTEELEAWHREAEDDPELAARRHAYASELKAMKFRCSGRRLGLRGAWQCLKSHASRQRGVRVGADRLASQRQSALLMRVMSHWKRCAQLASRVRARRAHESTARTFENWHRYTTNSAKVVRLLEAKRRRRGQGALRWWRRAPSMQDKTVLLRCLGRKFEGRRLTRLVFKSWAEAASISEENAAFGCPELRRATAQVLQLRATAATKMTWAKWRKRWRQRDHERYGGARRCLCQWRRRALASKAVNEGLMTAQAGYVLQLGIRALWRWHKMAQAASYRDQSHAKARSTSSRRRALRKWWTSAENSSQGVDKTMIALEHHFDACLARHFQAWAAIPRDRMVLARGLSLCFHLVSHSGKAWGLRQWQRQAHYSGLACMRRQAVASWSSAAARRRQQQLPRRCLAAWRAIVSKKSALLAATLAVMNSRKRRALSRGIAGMLIAYRKRLVQRRDLGLRMSKQEVAQIIRSLELARESVRGSEEGGMAWLEAQWLRVQGADSVLQGELAQQCMAVTLARAQSTQVHIDLDHITAKLEKLRKDYEAATESATVLAAAVSSKQPAVSPTANGARGEEASNLLQQLGITEGDLVENEAIAYGKLRAKLFAGKSAVHDHTIELCSLEAELLAQQASAKEQLRTAKLLEGKLGAMAAAKREEEQQLAAAVELAARSLEAEKDELAGQVQDRQLSKEAARDEELALEEEEERLRRRVGATEERLGHLMAEIEACDVAVSELRLGAGGIRMQSDASGNRGIELSSFMAASNAQLATAAAGKAMVTAEADAFSLLGDAMDAAAVEIQKVTEIEKRVQDATSTATGTATGSTTGSEGEDSLRAGITEEKRAVAGLALCL